MPSNFLTADTSFPDLSGNKSTNEKFEQLSSYLFMLLEQLRYSMANLGQENFNEKEFEDVATIIRKPVIAALDDQEGRITSLSLLVNGLSLSVDNGSTSSTISIVSNGVAISSQTIRFSGLVSFSDLRTKGSTVINGSNITTGTISAITVSACDIESSVFRTTLSSAGDVGGELELCYLSKDYVAGGIRLDDQGGGTATENKYRMYIYTESVQGIPFAMKFTAAGGMSFEAGEAIYLRGEKTATLVGIGGTYVSGTKVTIGSDSGTSTIDLKGTVYLNGELLTTSTT